MDLISARKNMVESQVRTNDVTDTDLQRALRTVARERFCAPARAFAAYAEAEVEIAPGRWLMKARDVGKLLQAAAARPGEKALAIAAPYAAAVLSEMGLDVTAQEADARASAVVEQGLRDYGAALVTQDFARPPGADYDLIICEAAVAEVPEAWLEALKPGGRLAVVLRDGPVGKARLFVKSERAVSSRELFDATPPVLAGFERTPTFQL
ncbi:MAG TPA: protein-L-isoaspartate O-methyltransferase [Caulobacteraceae bacterium]|nr:protein-L-isoaspartate O-methyltransferase [Caulobacteraceae bacterium]